MPPLLRQVLGIAATDLRLRLRRPATLWLILILSGLAYLLIPDPVDRASRSWWSTARVRSTPRRSWRSRPPGSHRSSSPSPASTSASNTIRRDLIARTGGIIAATPVSSGAYLVGKFLGGAAYLGLITAVYVLNVMAMHLLRGEGPLEPFTYFLTYALALGPAIIVVAALALMFECVPLLSGRLGDVLYFFIWAVLLAMGAMSEGGGAGRYLDVMGLGFIMRQVHAVSNSQQLAIGMTPFRGDVAPWVLPPIPLSFATLLPRLTVALLAVPILMVARLFFHRFDPARVKSGQTGRRQRADPADLHAHQAGHPGRFRRRCAPGTGRSGRTAPGARGNGHDALPVAAGAAGWLAVVATTIVVTDATVRHALPLVVAIVLAVALADLSTRDRVAGTPADALQHAAHQAGLRLHQAGRGGAAGPALLHPAGDPDCLQRSWLRAVPAHRRRDSWARSPRRSGCSPGRPRHSWACSCCSSISC